MTLAEIENELLIAPLRIYSDFEQRGLYAPELKDMGVTEDQIKKMKAMRSTFRWDCRFYKGDTATLFFHLR